MGPQIVNTRDEECAGSGGRRRRYIYTQTERGETLQKGASERERVWTQGDFREALQEVAFTTFTREIQQVCREKKKKKKG